MRPGHQALQRAGDDLLEGDQRDRQRGQHAVLDLAGVAELLHERQGDGLDALEEDRRGHHAGDEHAGERRPPPAPPPPTPWPILGKT